MNYNVLAYAIYLPISVYITYWVGRELHQNGRILMAEAFSKYQFDEWVDPINNTLLIGYYLLNIGAVFLVVTHWVELKNSLELIESLAKHVGFIVGLLGFIHGFNVILLSFLIFKKPNIKPP